MTTLEQLHGLTPLIVIALPLTAALLLGMGRWLIGTCLLLGSVLLSGYLLAHSYRGAIWHLSLNWIDIPHSALFNPLQLSLHVNFTNALLILLTTLVGFSTHLYAMATLGHGSRRYGLLMGGFISTMLSFWMFDNLLICFIGWELIGWGSYHMISYHHQSIQVAKNSTLVWLINQTGSLVFLIGILLTGHITDTWEIASLQSSIPPTPAAYPWLQVAKLCLIMGIGTKSAQWPWLVWLPRAMGAPTAASALIHSATLVGAGIYLFTKLTPFLGPTATIGIAYWGAATAFLGACTALAQSHPKRILAYSTVSQMGYVTMAIGMNLAPIALLYFITQAFAKACLFLSSDIITKQYSNTSKALRFAAWGAYLLAGWSLLGLPGGGGSIFKKSILAHTYTWATEHASAGAYWAYTIPVLAWTTSILSMAYISKLTHKASAIPRTAASPMSLSSSILMMGSIIMLSLGNLGLWYAPLTGTVGDSWLVQRLGIQVIIPAVLQHEAVWGGLGTTLLGILIYGVHIHSKHVAPWSVIIDLLKHDWHLDKWLKGLKESVLRISKTVSAWEKGLTQWLTQGVSIGGHMLGRGAVWLENKVFNAVVCWIATYPRHLSHAYALLQQKEHPQEILLWMLVTVALLMGTLYWPGW